MEYSAGTWLLLNFISIVVLAFYSMTEMACVSFNRVRLHYYVSKGQKRAIWLNNLLHSPSKLFGTTLIGVNVAMFFGSEFSREFHSAIGIDPDFAPLTQVLLVVILGELAPMFAARSYPEHVALLGIPILYASSKIMYPFVWILELINHAFSYFFRGKETHANIYITQEELQKILEEKEEDQPYTSDREQFNQITSNIFNLRHKTAIQIMIPFSHIPMIPSNATVEDARKMFVETDVETLPIYHNDINNIIGVVSPSDLIRLPDTKKAREGARPPLFITAATKLMSLLNQFQHKTQEEAIVLDNQGYAVGIITLEDVMEEIFGRVSYMPPVKKGFKGKNIFIDRIFPADLKVEDFNTQYDVLLDPETSLTLGELLEKKLGHHPEEGESIYIDPFELKVEETTLRGIKSIGITTKMK